MKDELWAVVKICVYPHQKGMDEYGNRKVNHYHWHVVREWHYPKWIINKHRPFFTWVLALYQARFKFHYVAERYCGYYPQTKELMQSKRQLSISSAKAQVTKIENLIMEYETEKSKTLWNDLTNDLVYQKLKNKLQEKKSKLQEAVQMAIEETI